MLNLLRVNNCIEALDQLESDPTIIVTDWYGKQSEVTPRFVLAADESQLHFAVFVNSEPKFDHSLIPDSFVPDLWRQDVAELFIKKVGGPEYLEFNLSPSGAWWGAEFSSYREQSKNSLTHTGIEVQASNNTTFWRGMISIPFSVLTSLPTSAAGFKAQVCFISGENPRQYFSTGSSIIRTADREPDFHLAELFDNLSHL